MAIQLNSWTDRLGWSALFGLAAAMVGVIGALITGVGFVFLLPGIFVGLLTGLIPFEGKDIGTYLLISAAFNFLFYVGCFYFGSWVWTSSRESKAS